MTLKEWQQNNNVCIARHAHARCLPSDCANKSQLFHLDDYYVSSIAAGTIWMIRKKPFSEKEIANREDIRNSCKGMTLAQLDLYMNCSYDFARDCIEEFLMEAEAQQQDKTPA